MKQTKEEKLICIHNKMMLLRNARIGYVSQERNLATSIFYFIKGVAREFGFFPNYFNRKYIKVELAAFDKKWLKRENGQDYYDLNGAKLPKDPNYSLRGVFQDTFYIHCLFDDKYAKELVLFLDSYLCEGVYGYSEGNFNVTVNRGDVVIDAGAWIGDFSAYAVAKGAEAYAFEPTKATYDMLCKTAILNGKDKLHPIKKGLGDKQSNGFISICNNNPEANSVAITRGEDTEQIELTTIDAFVAENKLTKVDFIKADIEGFERNMLLGATETLRRFAPKLAICTYHLPDDLEVLERIVLDANPNYTVIHLQKKMFAQVVPN